MPHRRINRAIKATRKFERGSISDRQRRNILLRARTGVAATRKEVKSIQIGKRGSALRQSGLPQITPELRKQLRSMAGTAKGRVAVRRILSATTGRKPGGFIVSPTKIIRKKTK